MRLSDKSFAKCPVDINRLSYAYDKRQDYEILQFSSTEVLHTAMTVYKASGTVLVLVFSDTATTRTWNLLYSSTYST